MKRLAVASVIVLPIIAMIVWSLNLSANTSAFTSVEYSATDLISGQRVSVADYDYRGAAVLLTSWATWCIECKKELPSLSKLWEEKQTEGLVVIAVNIDLPGESRGINTIIKKYALTWHDPNNQYSARFKALGMPTSVLIDSQGCIVKEWIGSVDFQSKEVNDLINVTLTKAQ